MVTQNRVSLKQYLTPALYKQLQISEGNRMPNNSELRARNQRQNQLMANSLSSKQ